jgi:hypothetical protein
LGLSDVSVVKGDYKPIFKQVKLSENYVEIAKYFPRGSSKAQVV